MLGPSLGTAGRRLWSAAAALLAEGFELVAWDLPGHGADRSPAPTTLTMSALADGVLDAVDRVLARRGTPEAAFGYAGVSVGGAVGLELLLRHPSRLTGAVLMCTGARIGEPVAWQQRAETVRAVGTAALVEASRARWFAPASIDRDPGVVSAMLTDLGGVDDAGYAAVCGALAGFDVRDRLAEITTPVLAVAGEHDRVTPPESLREIAEDTGCGSYAVVPDAAHLVPAERPRAVARLVATFLCPHRTGTAERDVAAP